MSAEDLPQDELPALTVTVMDAADGTECGVCRQAAVETYRFGDGGFDPSRCKPHAPSMRKALLGRGHTLVDQVGVDP